MHNLLSEEYGIRYTWGGFLTWLVSRMTEIDVTQMLGFVALIIGLLIQVASHIRGTRADARAKIEHDLQIRILQKELSDGDK